MTPPAKFANWHRLAFIFLKTVSKLGEREGTVRLGEELLARERKSVQKNELLRASLLKSRKTIKPSKLVQEAEALLKEYVESAGEEERKAPDFLAAQFELGLSRYATRPPARSESYA